MKVPRTATTTSKEALNYLEEVLIADSERIVVTVIDFDSSASLDYALGDPGGANSSFSKIDSFGGTYIADGVTMAIDQLTGSGGSTSQRSAIVVFTDGEVNIPFAEPK